MKALAPVKDEFSLHNCKSRSGVTSLTRLQAQIKLHTMYCHTCQSFLNQKLIIDKFEPFGTLVNLFQPFGTFYNFSEPLIIFQSLLEPFETF